MSELHAVRDLIQQLEGNTMNEQARTIPLPRAVEPYAPPRVRAEQVLNQMDDLEMQLRTTPLNRIAGIMYLLSYGDMMEMSAMLAKSLPSEVKTPEDIAAWLYQWATDELKAAKEKREHE